MAWKRAAPLVLAIHQGESCWMRDRQRAQLSTGRIAPFFLVTGPQAGIIALACKQHAFRGAVEEATVYGAIKKLTTPYAQGTRMTTGAASSPEASISMLKDD